MGPGTEAGTQEVSHAISAGGVSQASTPSNRIAVYEDLRFAYDVHGNITERRIGWHTVQKLSYSAEHQPSVDKEYLVRVVYEGDTPDLAARTGERAAPLLEIHENDPVRTNVQAVFPPEQLQRLRHGLSLDGKPLLPAKVEWQNPEQLRFVLVEGKKRQIRRMCEQVGLKVVGLKRIRIGGVVLGNLPLGQWRYLGPDERF